MNDKSTKSQTHTSGSPEASVLNAALDSVIIELLKRYPQGLCPNEIREKVKDVSKIKKGSVLAFRYSNVTIVHRIINIAVDYDNKRLTLKVREEKWLLQIVEIIC